MPGCCLLTVTPFGSGMNGTVFVADTGFTGGSAENATAAINAGGGSFNASTGVTFASDKFYSDRASFMAGSKGLRIIEESGSKSRT